MKSPLAIAASVAAFATLAAAAPLGLFSGLTDVGAVSRATIASFDDGTGIYTISASGDNMWAQRDAFGFVWTQATGDVGFAADIELVGTSAQAHRKAALMFRQSLAPDSAYVDVAVHGDGLTSLQFRSDQGGPTREIQCPVKSPRRVLLEKRGDHVSLAIAGDDGALAPSGCTIRLPLTSPFFVGLAVCAHDNAAVETARFSRVEFGPLPARGADALRTSALEILPLASLDRKVVYRASGPLASPHFSRTGTTLFFNAGHRLHRLDLNETAPPTPIATGFATACSHHHGLSPDGSALVFSDTSETGEPLMYLVPVAGGTPLQVPVAAPARWQSWSPDGHTLAYTAVRGGNEDIFTIPVFGGVETQLTDAPGHDGGADYSPDGNWIYFHSDRSGRVQIWRMRADGSEPEQVTDDDNFNWFPHPSPDGTSIVYLSGMAAPTGDEPPEGEYFLRQLPVAGGAIRELARFHGGPGSLTVPPWSPDSAFLAFVSSSPER